MDVNSENRPGKSNGSWTFEMYDKVVAFCVKHLPYIVKQLDEEAKHTETGTPSYNLESAKSMQKKFEDLKKKIKELEARSEADLKEKRETRVSFNS